MKDLLVTISLSFVVSSVFLCATITPSLALSANVCEYGAKGDSQTDDSQAFLKAWEDVCNSNDEATSTLVIPSGKTYMLQPLEFCGPCKPASLIVQVEGNVVAPSSIEDWQWPDEDDQDTWVKFSGISGLVVQGGGQIDGQGAPWWEHKGEKASYRPTALGFHRCENLTVMDLIHINSPKNHISINRCNSSYLSNLHIIAPADSPNTDGIDVSETTNLIIFNSTMETGDDCIAINGGTSFVNISQVYCALGHGISIGSLGKNGDVDEVEEIHVQNCIFNATTNGARIKTWLGGRGYARKITFEDITLISAENPVIINQQYEDHHINDNDNDNYNAVVVSDVTYRNITGTSPSEDVIKLSCDVKIGCNNIILEEIHITPCSGNEVHAYCTKVEGKSSSCSPRISCLSNELSL